MSLAALAGVWLTNDVEILLDGAVTEVTVTKRLLIGCSARIRYTNTANVLTIKNTLAHDTAVTAIDSVVYPTVGNQNATRLTVSSLGPIKANSKLLIDSEDMYSWRATTEKAELMSVLAVDAVNNYVYLHGELSETFATNVRARLLADTDVIYEFLLEGAGDIDSTTATVAAAVRHPIADIFTVNSRAKVDARNAWGSVIGRFSSWSPYLEVFVNKSRNNSGLGSYGYGVEDCGATRFCETHVKAQNVRHGFTTVMRDSVVSGSLWQKGRQRNGWVTGHVVNPTSAGFDTHDGAWRYTFENCSVRYTHLAAVNPETGTQRGFQARGQRETYINPSYVGNGLMFIVGGNTTYGEPNEVEIVNPINSKTTSFTGTSTFLTVPSGNTDLLRLRVIGGICKSTAVLLDYTADAYLNVEFIGGFRASDAGRLRIGGGSRLLLDGFSRSLPSGTMERILVAGTSYLDMLDFSQILEGAATASGIVQCTGAGAAVVNVGNVRATIAATGYTFVQSDGVNTPDVRYGKETDRATTAQLESITDPVNTQGLANGMKFRLNTTTNKPVYKVGTAASSTWRDATGVVAHTPV